MIKSSRPILSWPADKALINALSSIDLSPFFKKESQDLDATFKRSCSVTESIMPLEKRHMNRSRPVDKDRDRDIFSAASGHRKHPDICSSI